MQASNVLTECIGDQEHLTFNVDVKVTNTAEDKSYAPVTASDKKCKAELLGFRVAKIKVKEYAQQYFTRNKFRELRGQKLVNELENKLQAKLGSTVSIPITTAGEPRTCPRSKRDVTENKKRCYKKKTCPNGFTRMGNEEKCGKFMGMNTPNCNIYGSNNLRYLLRLQICSIFLHFSLKGCRNKKYRVRICFHAIEFALCSQFMTCTEKIKEIKSFALSFIPLVLTNKLQSIFPQLA